MREPVDDEQNGGECQDDNGCDEEGRMLLIHHHLASGIVNRTGPCRSVIGHR